MKRTLYILLFTVSAAMAATGCRDFDPILPFDAPKYVSSNAQTVTGRNIKVSFSENTSESLTREISVYYTPDDPDLFDWGVHMTQLPYGMTEEEYLQWLDSL